MFANLKITKLARPTVASLMQDIANLQSVQTNMLERSFTWTSEVDSQGRLIYVGKSGAHVAGWNPMLQPYDLNTIFSRSLSR